MLQLRKVLKSPLLWRSQFYFDQHKKFAVADMQQRINDDYHKRSLEDEGINFDEHQYSDNFNKYRADKKYLERNEVKQTLIQI